MTDTTTDVLARIRAASTPGTFPRDVLTGARSAADFFGAGFLGQNSAIHLLDAGIEDVVVVDYDEAKLATMSSAYPSTWRFWPSDCYAAARILAEDNHTRRPPRIADVVVVDPWTNGIDRAIRNLGVWTEIAARYVVIGVHEPWLAGRGALSRAPVAIDAAFQRVEFAARPARPFRVVDVVKRSDHVGGVWWAVVDVGPVL